MCVGVPGGVLVALAGVVMAAIMDWWGVGCIGWWVGSWSRWLAGWWLRSLFAFVVGLAVVAAWRGIGALAQPVWCRAPVGACIVQDQDVVCQLVWTGL